jgi:lipopolysaccharide/colanic/teichoic acid biosynthesis glycosyltransferase
MNQERFRADYVNVAAVGDRPRKIHRHDGFYLRSGKRMLDLTLAVALLVMLAPLIAGVALLVRVDGGPAIYGHRRVGKGGIMFRCLKFRTMVTNSEEVLLKLLQSDPVAAEEWKAEHKLTNDPRITRTGKFLRVSSLDELPQLINVLRGDMSFVGPRPVTEEELSRYGLQAVDYLAMRPGLTGLWQVHGRGKVSYDERVAMDSRYVRSVGFWSDLWLIAMTSVVVLRKTGK